MPIISSADICTSVLCFWSWLIVLWGGTSHQESPEPAQVLRNERSSVLCRTVPGDTNFSVSMRAMLWWMGGTRGWVLDFSPKDQLSQASLSKINTQVPLTYFSGSQWRPNDSPGNWLSRTEIFGNPFSFFEKRPTLSHFNVISWRGSLLCFPAPCFSNYCCPLDPQDFIAFKTVECSSPQTYNVVWPTARQGVGCAPDMSYSTRALMELYQKKIGAEKPRADPALCILVPPQRASQTRREMPRYSTSFESRGCSACGFGFRCQIPPKSFLR